MRHRKHRILALLVALTIVAVSCGGDNGSAGNGASRTGSGDTPDAQVDPNGVARISYDLVKAGGGGFAFDPTLNRSPVPDIGLLHWIFGALMRPTPEGTLEPDLAREATVVDERTIEVTLREGITFPAGTPIDADAVKAALERNLADETLVAFQRGFFSLEEIEVTGPDTLVLHIPDGTAASWFDTFMGGVETLLIPADVDFSRPAGAGPFRVTSFVPEQRITFEKNPDHWAADQIRLGGIEVVHAEGSLEASSALRAGQIDLARLTDTTALDSVGSAYETIVEPDPNNVMQMYICKSTEPFDDPKVRQALSYAIDREAISEALFEGAAVPAWDLWPVGHRLHNDELTERYAHDPEEARRLLAEAGHADGLTFDFIPHGSAGTAEVAEIVQQQWAEAGATANIVVSTNFAEDFLRSHKAPMAVVPGGSTQGRGKLSAYTGPSLSNACAYEDAELAALVTELGKVSDSSDEAVELWAEIQEIVVGDVLSLLVLFQPTVDAYDGSRLGDVVMIQHKLRVPDVYQLYVKA